MGELLVRGVAEGRLPPTHAVLDVRVATRDAGSQDAAIQRAAAVCAVVDGALAEAQRGETPLVRVAETSSIRTGEVIEHTADGHRRRVGWRAERGTRVECVPDADGLTALVQALVADDIRLSGPRWHVAPDAPQWDALRTAAVADAIRRAKAYAQGVDGEIGAVRWIAEPGLRTTSDDARPRATMTLARAEATGDHDAGDQLAMRVAVEPVAVEVTVEVALDLA